MMKSVTILLLCLMALPCCAQLQPERGASWKNVVVSLDALNDDGKKKVNQSEPWSEKDLFHRDELAWDLYLKTRGTSCPYTPQEAYQCTDWFLTEMQKQHKKGFKPYEPRRIK